jgi:hypothetical protein
MIDPSTRDEICGVGRCQSSVNVINYPFAAQPGGGGVLDFEQR